MTELICLLGGICIGFSLGLRVISKREFKKQRVDFRFCIIVNSTIVGCTVFWHKLRLDTCAVIQNIFHPVQTIEQTQIRADETKIKPGDEIWDDGKLIYREPAEDKNGKSNGSEK